MWLRTPIVHRMWEKSQRDMEADLAHECHGFYRVGISSILLFGKKMATSFIGRRLENLLKNSVIIP